MSDIIVVGGGIAGLTASAYLARSGYKPLLLEKEPHIGGLIGSFMRDGFTYDWGIRATEDSGMLFPMLKQLGIDVEFVKNRLSLGLEDQVISLDSENDVEDYGELLRTFYPENSNDISAIIEQIKKTMGYMQVQYDIDNPTFLDTKEDLGYILREVLPWVFKYIWTVPKINKLNVPVVPYLERFTRNHALIDVLTQHFFKDIPAYFALSYLKIYLDYYYPVGGTGVLPSKLADYIQQNGGVIKTSTRITVVNPVEKSVTDDAGNRYDYSQLVWAADLHRLYELINPDVIESSQGQAIKKRKQELKDKQGNDSVFTVYLGVDLEPGYFSEKHTEHFFYTPSKNGESSAGPIPYGSDKQTIKEWLSRFAALTTYEIAVPVLRDKSLAPNGKTGLIISALFDYHLTEEAQSQGWYDEFREYLMGQMIEVLNDSIYPGIKTKIIHRFSSTPISIETRTGNLHGAITGWAFTNDPMPAESRLPKIFSSTETPIPCVVQAGQWTYSPSGFPISILTGKLAADRVINNLKK